MKFVFVFRQLLATTWPSWSLNSSTALLEVRKSCICISYLLCLCYALSDKQKSLFSWKPYFILKVVLQVVCLIIYFHVVQPHEFIFVFCSSALYICAERTFNWFQFLTSACNLQNDIQHCLHTAEWCGTLDKVNIVL